MSGRHLRNRVENPTITLLERSSCLARWIAVRACLGAFVLLAACALKKQPSDGELVELAKQPIPPERAGAVLEEAGENFLYGHGVGETALTVGSVLLFPPYALYVLGNGALSLSGYEPLEVSRALPEKERREWNEVYDAVTALPGEAAAAVAGEQFRDRDTVKQRTRSMLKAVQTPSGEDQRKNSRVDRGG